MHLMPHLPTLLLTLTLAATTLAHPAHLSLAEVERRWSAGETEVSDLSCRPNSAGCWFYAWFAHLASLCADARASIHSGTTHRDATPAWPVQREAEAVFDGAAFAFATDERTMLRAQRQRRAESTPTLAKMKAFVQSFYRSRSVDRGVIARDTQSVSIVEEDAAPVLKPRKGMRYAFKA